MYGDLCLLLPAVFHRLKKACSALQIRVFSNMETAEVEVAPLLLTEAASTRTPKLTWPSLYFFISRWCLVFLLVFLSPLMCKAYNVHIKKSNAIFRINVNRTLDLFIDHKNIKAYHQVYFEISFPFISYIDYNYISLHLKFTQLLPEWIKLQYIICFLSFPSLHFPQLYCTTSFAHIAACLQISVLS